MARARTETHLVRRFAAVVPVPVDGDADGDAGRSVGCQADADEPASVTPSTGSAATSATNCATAPATADSPERAIEVADLGRRPEAVLVEEPLEIRVDAATVNTTMRTPGHDYELAAGWCHAEGILDGASIRGIRYCATGSAVDSGFNIVTVDTVGRAVAPEPRLTPTTSSCGICGNDAVDALTERLQPLANGPLLGAAVIAALSGLVAGRQELFDLTGASHAAAAIDADGDVVVVREDIGRHNAVDKVVGRLLLDGALPATGQVLWVSGRASFEMVQKAWAGGFAALVSVSAPSSLAVRTAERAGLVLIGFSRSARFTVYAGAERFSGAEPAEVVAGDPSVSKGVGEDG
ncbi:MAG TPA: formate dehydrogenase accessory sulfurtransferase FdhD [Microthrixaceae bacterium]|nr:formate dehydrogenase accessory sulfurtransferase FdhD [Microthrixaceae bacterium]